MVGQVSSAPNALTYEGNSMGSHLIRTILAAGLIAIPVAAQGQSKDSCQSLLRRGGKVIDTYVMDFGTGDKPTSTLRACPAARRRNAPRASRSEPSIRLTISVVTVTFRSSPQTGPFARRQNGLVEPLDPPGAVESPPRLFHAGPPKSDERCQNVAIFPPS